MGGSSWRCGEGRRRTVRARWAWDGAGTVGMGRFEDGGHGTVRGRWVLNGAGIVGVERCCPTPLNALSDC
jgi:hypothetical protein